MSIDFSICCHCGRPIFFDWKGAHHVKETHYLPAMMAGIPCDYSKPECRNPEESPEENEMPSCQPLPDKQV